MDSAFSTSKTDSIVDRLNNMTLVTKEESVLPQQNKMFKQVEDGE